MRLLLRTGHTQVDVAERLGVHRSLVSRWLAGERVATSAHRRAMREAYDIPIVAWKQPASRTPVARVHTSARHTEEESLEAGAGELVDAPTARGALSEAEFYEKVRRISRLVDRLSLDAEDPNATPLERARIVTAVVAQVEQLGRVTGHTLKISEARIIRLPAFRRVADAIVETLKPWPDARRALADRLLELGDEEGTP